MTDIKILKQISSIIWKGRVKKPFTFVAMKIFQIIFFMFSNLVDEIVWGSNMKFNDLNLIILQLVTH